MATTAKTVLIVDDHAGFRRSARALLEADERLEVVGEAGTGVDAVDSTTRLRPDIVLLDIALPDIDGFAVCESVMQGEIPPVVVLTSSRSRFSFGTRLAVSSARGFIAKDDLTATRLLDLAG